MKFKYR